MKVNKFSLLSPEKGPGLDLVDRGAATAAGLGVPPASGHGESTSPLSPLSMAEEDARAKVYREEELQLQLQECVSQQDFIGAEACKQKLGKLPLQCDAETLQNQGAQVTDREQNILADEQGAKRTRTLKKYICRGRAAKEG